MDLQTAKLSNKRLLNLARVAALVCFAVAGLLLFFSLQAHHKTGLHDKGIALSTDRSVRAL